jgi:cytochrome bd ubiquinol oxidase subunit I
MSALGFAAAFAPVDQHYLLEARQMQALSLAVHLALVAFAISFPAMVMFVERLGQRTRDRLYLTLAPRGTQVMAALFAELTRRQVRAFLHSRTLKGAADSSGA